MAAALAPRVPGYNVERVGPQRAAQLDDLYRRSADFVRLVQGREPGPGEGLALLAARPTQLEPEGKIVFGVSCGGRLVALIDLLRDYPAAGTWYLGLLMVETERRRQGLGALIYGAVAEWIAAQGGARVRLVVQSHNPGALQFWEHMGFERVDTTTQRIGDRDVVAIRMEHQL